MLIGKGLVKRYGTTEALAAVDCSVEGGQITAIIGPSGSGKSTLLRILALVEPPDAGFIEIDGEACVISGGGRPGMAPPWPALTIVFQQLFLWPHLTLRGNILLPAQKRRIAHCEQKLAELVEAFGMSGFVDRYPNQTSQGQRQRAALTRALLLDPTYLLLDEITSALDVGSIAAVVDRLNKLRSQGVGIVMVTHLLGFARRSADRVMFMDSGAVLEAGGKEVLERPEHPKLQRFMELMERSN